MVDVLFFYSKSADKPPGKGVNEKVCDQSVYSNLGKDWRKTLSNFHEGVFEYEGRKYRTIEHSFHAKKISIVDEKKALDFCIESGSALSKGDGNDARKNRKMVVLSSEDLEKWNKIKFKALEEMQYCKFSQVEDARQVLLATCNAELWHGTRGTPKARQFSLEKARQRIKDEQNAATNKSRKRKLEDDPNGDVPR
ncbi:hypothetical protein AKO1_007549, partial [Acrasis kona]